MDIFRYLSLRFIFPIHSMALAMSIHFTRLTRHFPFPSLFPGFPPILSNPCHLTSRRKPRRTFTFFTFNFTVAATSATYGTVFQFIMIAVLLLDTRSALRKCSEKNGTKEREFQDLIFFIFHFFFCFLFFQLLLFSHFICYQPNREGQF